LNLKLGALFKAGLCKTLQQAAIDALSHAPHRYYLSLLGRQAQELHLFHAETSHAILSDG